MENTTFHNQKQYIDDAGDLITHLLDSIAFTSEKTIASIVLLLSMVPETIGVGSVMGYTVGVVSAAVSLVTVKLALRDDGKAYTLPFIGKRKIYFGWLLYLLNLAAGFAFVYSTGRWVDLFLIVVSFCGAVSSEQIAQVIKVEMVDRAKVDLQSAKDAIKLQELEANAQLRVASKRAAFNAQFGDATTATQTPNIAPNVKHDTPVAISEDQRQRGQQASQEQRQTAAQARQMEIYQLLTSTHAGQDVDSINKSELARQFDVSSTTIKRDIEALRSGRMLNGVVA